MVPCLARGAVIIKSKNDTSLFLSNYELAYALGLLCRIGEFKIPDYGSVGELLGALRKPLENYKSEEIYIKNLCNMILEYIPDEIFDEQMRELVLMGFEEEHMWNEKI